MTTFTATYSPEDNKLRLYASARLDAETYAEVKKAGFQWAPKQDLFYALWTPAREDLLIDLAGEIDDEDYSPMERAADRAERFGNYRDKRAMEAGARADTFEAGPSAFGHQNRERAERQASRHDRHRTGAVSQWRKAEYWQQRTEGVISHALYKADPAVRRGRIKTIESELRSIVARYTPTHNPPRTMQDTNKAGDMVEFVHVGPAGRGGYYIESSRLDAIKLGYARWVEHYEMRLTYERAMLANEGGSASDVEMEAGGWIGRHQIHGVTRSPVTKKIVSVKLMTTEKWGKTVAPYLKSVNIERLPEDAYRAPTDEERAQFATATQERKAKAKAEKPDTISLINPTDADADRLQEHWNAKGLERYTEASKDRTIYSEYKPSTIRRMTQAQYSELSKGNYARCETVPVCQHGSQPERQYGRNIDASPIVCKVRVSKLDDFTYYAPQRVVIITDKPQKPLPASMFQPVAVVDTLEPVEV